MSEVSLRMFAVSPPGLEAVVAAELLELGNSGQTIDGGVEWTGTLPQLRQANLQLRTASRILVRVGDFRARTFFELERLAARVPWRDYITARRQLALRVTARKSKLYHERAIAERLERAIQEQTDARAAAAEPDEEEGAATQLIVVRVLRDQFTISIDSSGALLHRRGYRQETGPAPLRETTAAALLHIAGWKGREPLLDLFCGSGTIPIEAALLARNIPPGLASAAREPRAFAFEHWPTHDAGVWRTQVAAARGQIRERAKVSIYASDRSASALRAAQANAARAGVEQDIEWTVAPMSEAPAPAQPGVLITNPPYGVRVNPESDLRDLYAALGEKVRAGLTGWRTVMLLADPRLAAQLRLPLSTAAETRNGGIAVRVLVSGQTQNTGF